MIELMLVGGGQMALRVVLCHCVNVHEDPMTRFGSIPWHINVRPCSNGPRATCTFYNDVRVDG